MGVGTNIARQARAEKLETNIENLITVIMERGEKNPLYY
jgi:hypothetical protein